MANHSLSYRPSLAAGVEVVCVTPLQGGEEEGLKEAAKRDESVTQSLSRMLSHWLSRKIMTVIRTYRVNDSEL